MKNPIKDREKLLKIEIKRIIEVLRKEYKPKEIILFGSVAKGKIHAWSDIDLLIVKETQKRPVERCVEVCKIARPAVGIDVFVYTPAEYQILMNENVSFLRNILKDGKILYAQRD